MRNNRLTLKTMQANIIAEIKALRSDVKKEVDISTDSFN